MSERNVGVVIVAAGAGTRVGGKELKQFRWVAGKPMLLHSLQTFMGHPRVVAVVCVIPRNYAGDPPPWIFQCDVDRLLVSTGGRTRMESVASGLYDLVDDATAVLIHDAARPFVDTDTIDRVLAGVDAGQATVAALPVVDTLKEADANGLVARTVDRSRLWRAQTPQGFPREMIMRAHEEGKQRRLDATDDAALCEALGIPVHLVPGDERAMKITTEADFTRAEALFTLQA
jgi:2-C-methyl-D-erythritol 4-phosphate cytidylyltransferase